MRWIAPLLATLVLAGACSVEDERASRPTTIRWLAAGDSFSSAEGLVGGDGDCVRSPLAYAPLAHDTLSLELEITEFAFVACTGARLDDFDAQLAEALEERTDDPRFELITLTLGGNDAGFGLVLLDCLGFDDAARALLAPILGTERRECDVTRDELIDRVESLEQELVELYSFLADEVVTPDGEVIVVGYPNLLADPERWATAPDDRCEGVRADDVETIRLTVDRLAETFEGAAEAVDRVSYLDVRGIFDGHELCSEAEWLNGLITGISNRTFRIQGSFHPNEVGHQAMTDLLVAEIRRRWAIS